MSLKDKNVVVTGGSRGGGNIFRIVLPPVIQMATTKGGRFTFTWSATIGRSYQVQYATDLGQNNWKQLTSFTATNTTATVSDDVSSDRQRLYRVLLLP